MSILEDIRNSEIYQVIFQEGVELGKEMSQQAIRERRKQGFKQCILNLVSVHFSELASEAETCVNAYSDEDLIYQLLMDIINAKSLEEARSILENSRAAETIRTA